MARRPSEQPSIAESMLRQAAGMGENHMPLEERAALLARLRESGVESAANIDLFLLDRIAGFYVVRDVDARRPDAAENFLCTFLLHMPLTVGIAIMTRLIYHKTLCQVHAGTFHAERFNFPEYPRPPPLFG